MIEKIIGFFICMLIILTIIPSCIVAGDKEDPEINDKSKDTIWKHFDILSAWFHEDANDPDYL